MQISYQREFRHNYLIIDPEELIWQGYESQMLRKNPIEGLLRFQIRQIDEKVRFYYEITSRQPLVRILKNRNIQADEIRRLMLGIFGALERMDTFLLREERILLDPEYLYVDSDTFRVWLCVIPGLKKNFPESFGKLLEYLLGNVDHQDKESVVLAYGLYQETRKENYGLTDLVRMLQGEKEPEEKTVCRKYERQNRYEQKPELPGKEEMARKGGNHRDEKSLACGDDGPKRDAQRAEGKNGWKERCRQWKIPFFHKPDHEEEALPARVPWEMMYQELASTEEREEGIRERPSDRGSSSNPTSQGTVLLADISEGAEQRMLRALDAGGKDIPIPYYPFIIGKQENLVDFKLDQDTVSRLHVKIDRDKDSYRIKDLNSTNGTMLRGRLLENNEEAEIRAGDEICIARFRYRFE